MNEKTKKFPVAPQNKSTQHDTYSGYVNKRRKIIIPHVN